MKYIDLTGQKFGRLTVVKRVENYVSPKGQKQAQWLCKCKCGNLIVVRCGSLRTGNNLSCGCLGKEHRTSSLTTHGHCNNRLYRTWKGMKSRCYNPNNKKYPIYGAEGKTVCEEWQEFKPFYDWSMSHGYRDDLTIERIDGAKGYSPDNCRWATDKEQANNTRRNHFIEYNGKTQTIAQWADETKIKYATLYMRINKLHWNIERALTTK